jgi:hypothetical protein
MLTRMHKKEGYLKAMERKLAAWKTVMETRAAEAEKAAPRDKAELQAKVAAWKVSGALAFEKLEKLRAAAAVYGVIRAELDAVWGTMGGVDEPAAIAPVQPIIKIA